MRVLIVDDHEGLARSIATLLSPEVETSSVCSVDAAIAAITREQPDCLLVDLAMPSGGGVAVYRWVRATVPDLARRTVFMTGFSEEIARGVLGELPNPIILKPFGHRELLEVLRSVAR